MQIHHERVPRAAHESFRCFVREEASFPFRWHTHPECELTLITQGRGWRYVGQQREPYQAGDLVLLGPGLPHTWASGPAARGGRPRQQQRAIVVQFRPDFLGAPFLDAPEARDVRRLLAAAGRGLRVRGRLRDRVAAELERLPARHGWERLLALLGLLGAIARGGRLAPIASPGYRIPAPEAGGLRLAPLLDHLHASYREPCAVPALARRFGGSVSTLARAFKRGTGRTVVRYLQELRLGHAAEQLLETDRTVAEIGFASGFQNLSHFNRLFRRAHGQTPRAYRRHYGDRARPPGTSS